MPGFIAKVLLLFYGFFFVFCLLFWGVRGRLPLQTGYYMAYSPIEQTCEMGEMLRFMLYCPRPLVVSEHAQSFFGNDLLQ